MKKTNNINFYDKIIIENKNNYDLIKDLEKIIKKYKDYNLLRYIHLYENRKFIELTLYKKIKMKLYNVITIEIKNNDILKTYKLIKKFIFNKKISKYNISLKNKNIKNDKLFKEKYYNKETFLNEYNLKSLINENNIYNNFYFKETKYYYYMFLENNNELIHITINKKYSKELKKEILKENFYINLENKHKLFLKNILFY